VSRSPNDCEVHPLAEIWPMMSEEQYQGLLEDIRQHGQVDPVVMYNGKLLDGRNRLRACTELGIECKFAQLPNGVNPKAWVMSRNHHRRHMTPTQRSAVAAKVAASGGESTPDAEERTSIDEAANMLQVSRRSVFSASYVQKHGCDAIKQMIASGEIAVNVAEKFCKEYTDKREQAKIAKGGKKAISAAMKTDSAKDKGDTSVAGSAKSAANKAVKVSENAKAATGDVPEDDAKPTASIVMDAKGVAVPQKYRDAHAMIANLIAVGREVDKFRKVATELGCKPGGEWLSEQDIDNAVRALKRRFTNAGYYTVCPNCKGEGEGCGRCSGVGWLPEELKGMIN
jgi:hypothetical protein